MRVSIGPAWSEYAGQKAGLNMLGVVTHEDGDSGALAQTAAGRYVQVKGELITDMDQDMVKVAIARARKDPRSPPIVS